MNEDSQTPSRLRVKYSPGFVESVVTQAVYGDRKREAQLHRVIDPLFRLPAGRDRERQFSSAYWEFFLNLDLPARLAALLEERPLLTHEIAVCLVHEAPGSKNEGAELLLRDDPDLPLPERRTLALQVRPESLLDTQRLTIWARPELLHIADMVDPSFQYGKWSPEPSPAQDSLVRDRYRVLWDTWVEARLIRERRGSEDSLLRVRKMMDRVFSGFPDRGRQGALNRILTSETLTHETLLGWAREPEALLGKRTAPDMDTGSPHPGPGEACPLCNFSTFDWFDFEANGGDRFAREIAAARPEWHVELGACRQCAELYGCSPPVASQL